MYEGSLRGQYAILYFEKKYQYCEQIVSIGKAIR